MNAILSSQRVTYEVTTEVYQGPMALLLQLIETAQLDITKLALAQVTDQFLDHLNRIEERSPDEVSSFLVIAAKLLQIKSEVLLPRVPEREEGEEDPGEALARQLLEYKRFKQVADFLDLREKEGLQTYLRLSPPLKVEGKLDLDGIGLPDLVEAAEYIFNLGLHMEDKAELNTVVAAPKITIRQKIQMIASRFHSAKQTTFMTLIHDRSSRLDIVVTFLAILELIKRHFVSAHQTQLFGDIELEKAENWTETEDFELEFGE